MIRCFSISFNVNFRRLRDVFGLGPPLSEDLMGVPTSSRRYVWRRHLDSKMAAPELTSTKTWGEFFDPYCGGGGGGKWRPIRFRPSFREVPGMRSSKMATGSGRAAIFRHRHNRDRKTLPILLTYIYIYIYINTELLDGNQGHQEETHRPTHRFQRLFLDLLSMGWRGCASAMGAIKLPPSSPKIMCQSIYIIQYMQ